MKLKSFTPIRGAEGMTNDEIEAWAEQIPMEELYNYIRDLTGLDDLQFTTNIHRDRRTGYPRIEFSSEDLVDKVGFLSLMFESIQITQFNSSISVKDDDIQYWGTACFSYQHPSGGSNGYTFCMFRFDGSEWSFREQ